MFLTTTPSFKMNILGIDITPYSLAKSLISSTFTLTTFKSRFSLAISSTPRYRNGQQANRKVHHQEPQCQVDSNTSYSYATQEQYENTCHAVQ